MITPKTAEDHLRQKAQASSTFLRYTLELRYRGEDSAYGPLEIMREELNYIKKSDAPSHVLFDHSAKDWRSGVHLANRTTGLPYLRTEETEGKRYVKIQQEGTGGRPQARLTEPLPRTILSSLSAAESPTTVVARSEMASWRLLQLEPSALRRSDQLRDPPEVSADGAHMPAALFRMTQDGTDDRRSDGDAVRQRIANRMAQLVNDLRAVRVERDDKRELLTLLARLRDGTEHPARSLSDGTLRFLALAIIEQSTNPGGLFCLEEPENGMHPERVRAMLELLRDIAVDPSEPDGSDNPLRQVVVNTHSPLVVGEVEDDCLVIAEPHEVSGKPYRLPGRVSTVSFSALEGTWRTKKAGAAICSRGTLGSYLNPLARGEGHESRQLHTRRVVDRPDLQPLLPYPP